MTAQDQWSQWLLETRFAGDAAAAEQGMRRLRAVRDRVLEAARLRAGMTLLDVGTGDGLIAIGALDRVGETGHVIFSDISEPLLDHVRSLAEEIGALGRCSFVRASADDLRGVADASVDVVTTRSVLIYVKDKPRAFREFRRVLKPGGRISLFEPINSFNAKYEGSRWAGGDIAEIADLADRLYAFFRQLQPDDDPMMDFDERDLVRHCEDAGFHHVDIELHITVTPSPPAPWSVAVNSPGNPNIPSLAGAMQQIFTPEEAARFEAHARPRVEAGGRPLRGAVAYLKATKDGGEPPGEDGG